MMRLSLTQRLLALTLAAFLPGLIALVYNAIDLRNTRYNEVRAEATRNAQFVVSELDQIFDGIEGVLHAVSQAAEIGDGDVQRCADYVSRARASIDPLTSILILNLDGTTRCYSESRAALPNLSDRDYFKAAIANRKFSIGTYVASRVSNRNVIPLALPILLNNAVQGVVLAGLNLEWLGKHLKDRGVARGSAVTIADRNGIIISREPYPERYVGTPFPKEFRSLLYGNEITSREVSSRDGTDRILGYVPISRTPFGFYVSAGISRDEAFQQIDRAERASIALFGLGSVAALVLAWLVGESIIRRPLMRVVDTAEAWRRGEDSARTGILDRGDEIGLLGQTFDHLMDENAQRQSERDTAEARREILVHELAHRVKNTLATVQSIASLSFRHSQGPEALRGFQDRLQTLVRGHDLLTKKNWEHADLSEITEAAIAPLKEEKADRFSYSGPPVNMPPTSAVPVAMILHELCTNAVKYGALSNGDGHIAIRWTAAPDERGTAVSLTWTETGGPAIQRPDQEGFGSKLISNLTRQMHGSFDVRYPPSGLICHIKLVTPKFEPRS